MYYFVNALVRRAFRRILEGYAVAKRSAATLSEPDLSHIAEGLRSLAVPVGELVLDPANARTHPEPNLEALKGSLHVYGQRKPLVVNRTTGAVEAGNGTLQAAQALGWTHLAVVWVNDDAATAAGFAIADNRSAELAGWDQVALDKLLREVNTDNDPRLDAMLAELATQEGITATNGNGQAPEDPGPQIDRAAELQAKWQTASGQLWEIPSKTTPGKCHRILCGDSTKAEDVARLMGGERAALCLTDPPYGVGWDYKGTDDTQDNLALLIAGFLPLARQNADVVLLTSGIARQRLYPVWDWCLCWFVAAGTGVNPWGFTCWQPVLAYGKDPYLSRGKGSRPDGVSMTESSPDLSHPCPKPVGVWRWFMERGSVEQGDLVYDPFLGSGTTLIAAEQTGRLAYGCEISPAYVAVSLERLAGMGLEPRLIALP